MLAVVLTMLGTGAVAAMVGAAPAGATGNHPKPSCPAGYVVVDNHDRNGGGDNRGGGGNNNRGGGGDNNRGGGDNNRGGRVCESPKPPTVPVENPSESAPASTNPSASTSISAGPSVSPAPSVGPGTLPVTGANGAMAAGGGMALVGLGAAALFLVRRRRTPVKFVA
ncbi:MAG TPA: LPXTG cell wall anchor domain-containing protein [Micromonosporaceae bacterium]|nr:LPXTG cell wall anchor domain-containing protein [Micromonosporaceae bacterium]